MPSFPGRKRTRKGAKTDPTPFSTDDSDTKVFGVPFDRASDSIPVVIRKVVEYFNKSEHGQQSAIKEIIESFDAGIVPDLTSYDSHVVAGVLKQYLRELPEPLLTFELYDCFLAAACTYEGPEIKDIQFDRILTLHAVAVPEGAQANTVRKVLCMLPQSHRIVLKYLAHFLHRVSLSVETNKMTPANIAIVFAPNLLKPPGDDLLMQMRDTEFSNHLMNLFVSEYKTIFKDEPDPRESEPVKAAKPLVRGHRRSSSWSGSQEELEALAMAEEPICKPAKTSHRPKIDPHWLRPDLQSTHGMPLNNSAGAIESPKFKKPPPPAPMKRIRTPEDLRPPKRDPSFAIPPPSRLPPTPSQILKPLQTSAPSPPPQLHTATAAPPAPTPAPAIPVQVQKAALKPASAPTPSIIPVIRYRSHTEWVVADDDSPVPSYRTACKSQSPPVAPKNRSLSPNPVKKAPLPGPPSQRGLGRGGVYNSHSNPAIQRNGTMRPVRNRPQRARGARGRGGIGAGTIRSIATPGDSRNIQKQIPRRVRSVTENSAE